MELSGVLHQIDNIVTRESKDGRIYSSRTFVLKYALENKEQFIQFYLEPPNLNVIEKFETGQCLIVKFNLTGWISKSLYNPDETKVFEKKIVSDIKIDTKSSSILGKNIRLTQAPNEGYMGPDFTRDFSKFPEHIAF